MLFNALRLGFMVLPERLVEGFESARSLEFTLPKIQGPDLEVPSVTEDDLTEDWYTRLEVTRDLGTAWLEKMENVLLRVRSVIVPETVNFLLNPS